MQEISLGAFMDLH